MTFFLLPALLTKDKFINTDEIMCISNLTCLKLCNDPQFHSHLEVFCDRKDIGPIKVFRLNEVKLFIWLKSRITLAAVAAKKLDDDHLNSPLRKTLRDIISATPINQTSSSVPMFASSSAAADLLGSSQIDSKAYELLGFQVIAECLPVSVSQKFVISLGIINHLSEPEGVNENSATANLDECPRKSSGPKKRLSSNSQLNSGPKEDYLMECGPLVASSGTSNILGKKMLKAKGTRSITTFFTKI